jgi:hypothetical protein
MGTFDVNLLLVMVGGIGIITVATEFGLAALIQQNVRNETKPVTVPVKIDGASRY